MGNADYSKMTDQEFYDILEEISDCDLSIPGVYEACAEHLNNEVLDTWAERNPEKAWPEEKN
jgi:hypothetical protein